MKLTLEHLAPYLPYRLRYIDETDASWQLDGLYNNGDCYNNWVGEFPIEFCKPILRPLSDITKEIEVNGERFVPMDVICPKEEYEKDFDRKVAIGSIELQGVIKFSCTAFCIVQKLFEWHFDVFGLIDQNLAIDINTIKP